MRRDAIRSSEGRHQEVGRDWSKFLEDMEDIMKEWELEEQEEWYEDLEGDSPYKKLGFLRTKYLKESRITSRSKK